MLAEMETKMQDASFVLEPGEGKLVGGTISIKLRGEDTGGAVAIVESTLPPRTSGPPLHINTREDETFYILSGTLRLQLGERIIDARAGSLVYIPKGSVHTFCNPYDEPVRGIGVFSPSGFERYFEDVAELMESNPAGMQPDVARVIEVAQRYGGVLVGPPMSIGDTL